MSKKIKYQVLEKEFREANDFFRIWSHRIKVIDSPDEVQDNLPIITGADVTLPWVRNFLNNRQPAIYIARGYIGNHLYKTRKLWRYSINGWANTKLMPVPYSRWNTLKLERHPWKVKKVNNVLIAPSKMTAPAWDPEHGHNWANYASELFPGAEIKIRYKGPTPGIRWSTLWDDLDWADLVVAQGSAITAEAFWYGKKVISLNPCCTWAAGPQLLEDWQNPEEPIDRDAWHEHVAWCQFHNSEWQSGEALGLIQQYIGNVLDYDPGHSYELKV